MHFRFLISAVAVSAAILAAPATSAATQRYASPAGSGTTCTSGAPCDLSTAITGATGGDEVILKAGLGAYVVPDGTAISITHAIEVHGEDGQPRAQVSGNWVFAPLSPSTAGVTLRHLRLSNVNAPAITLGSGMTGRDIVATSVSQLACSFSTGGVLTDSVCRNTGASGAGAGANSGNPFDVVLRNVTAVGPDDGISFYASFGPSTVDAKNVIAHATTAGPGVYDVRIGTQAGQAFAATFGHSNYASIITNGPATATPAGTGTNQTEPPQFVDAASGDFHQLVSSPTVDAGIDDPADGPVDIDGDGRFLGAAPDIGADEYVDQAPVAVADSLTVAQDSAATAVDVLANDTDTDGGPKVVSAVTQPGHGAATFSGSGATYQPAAGYCGPDSFTYTLNGGSVATVSVTVTCAQVNQPPSDTTAPNTKRIKGPKRKSRARLAKATFSSTEAGSTFECKLDRKPWKACTSPFKRKVAVGKHVLSVRATDAAGNTDPTPLKFRWTALVPKPQQPG